MTDGKDLLRKIRLGEDRFLEMKEQVRRGGAPRSRNEMMANAMVVRGLMERRGRGWLTMRHAMARFNGTEPELVNDERNRFVRVTFCTGTGVGS